MDKPISIIINETRQQLINAINSSNLPPSITEMILKEIYDEIRILSVKEYEEAQRKMINESAEETLK